jgi:chemotaxis protein methyltransferase CheR
MSAALKLPLVTSDDTASFDPAQAADLFHSLIKDTKGFESLAQILRQRAGINLPLTGKNLSLMAGRVGPLLRRSGLGTYRDLLQQVSTSSSDTHNVLFEEFVRVMTTNTTHWFREEEHFTTLEKLLIPRFEEMGRNREVIKIWCAAASSGPEPYTLAIVAKRAWQKFNGSAQQPAPVKILGTDINEKVLSKAASGIYTQSEIRGLSADFVKTYLIEHQKPEVTLYQVKKELSDLVQFAPLNLMSPTFPFKSHFHFIFCRNVFIYFEKQVCNQIIEKMAFHQKPGHFLFLGHSEVGAMKSNNYKVRSHAVFERI